MLGLESEKAENRDGSNVSLVEFRMYMMMPFQRIEMSGERLLFEGWNVRIQCQV